MRRFAAAVLLLASLPATAWSQEIESVVPGQKLWGETIPNQTYTVLIRGIEGVSLTVTCKAWKGSAMQPILALSDPDGRLLDVDDFLVVHKTFKKVTLRKFPLPRTGTFRLSVTARTGTFGGFDITTKGRAPKKLGGTGTVAAPGEVVPLPFAAMDGDEVRCLVKKKGRKSQLLASILRYVDHLGEVTDLGVPKKTEWLPIAANDVHRFDVTGLEDSTGEFKYALKFRRAKHTKRRRNVSDLHATGSVTGRLVIEGDSDRETGAGKSASRTRKEARNDARQGELIVRTRGARTSEEARRALRAEFPGTDFEVLRSLTPEGPHLVRVRHLAVRKRTRRRKRMTQTLAKAASAAADVVWCEPNGRVHACDEPVDQLFPLQWHHRYLNLPEAWTITRGDPSGLIAVVDTGIDTHPDLQGKLQPGYDFVADPNSSFDGGGWDNDPTDSARDFHGVHVAGLAAAHTNNSIGVAGAGWQTGILPVRVLGADNGSFFDVAAGLRWAVGLPVAGVPDNPNPARVVNMSLGAAFDSVVLREAVLDVENQTNAVIIAAAGNEGSAARFYPAAYDTVLSVYALDSNLFWTSYSNWGDWIDVGAPGGDFARGLRGILSTYMDVQRTPYYEELQGTSMAAPQVAGVAALVLSVDPTLTAKGVRDLLTSTATDLGVPGFDVDFGYGVVDARAAVVAASGQAGPPPRELISAVPDNLKFGRVTGALRFYVVSNDGVSAQVTALDVATENGDWLTARTENAQLPAPILVTVDHASLDEGVHRGTLTVHTTRGALDVPVQVNETSELSIGNVRVFALDASGNEIAAATATRENGWAYSLDSLPLGTYRIGAIADRDSDLKVDLVDEYEGTWPLPERPLTLDVSQEQPDRGGIDFSLQRFDARFRTEGVSGGAIDGAVAVRITDALTGLPISGARVYIGDGAFASGTDERGRAVVTGNFSGNQTVSATATGYSTSSRVRVNAQFQAFRLEPLTPPAPVAVTLNILGLGADDRAIEVRFGDAVERLAYSGTGALQTTLDVPRTGPSLPLTLVVYAIDGTATGFLDSFVALPAGEDTVAADVTVAAPLGGSRGRNVTLDVPTFMFVPGGATLTSRVLLRDEEARRSVQVGFGSHAAGVESAFFWAGPGFPDPARPLDFEVTATDVNGVRTVQILHGTTDLLLIPSPTTLPDPVFALVPPTGTVLSPVSPFFGFQPPPDASAVRLVVENTATGRRWELLGPGILADFVLPVLPEGGLEPGAAYSWSVETFRVPGFNLDAHTFWEIERDAEARSSTETRTFTTQ